MKKILVSLPDGVVETLDNELIGKVGQTRSDTLRTIIMNWLSQQGYLPKVENVKTSKVKRGPSEEIDLLDTMLSSLVELLEEKGILTQEEYEKRIMEKVKIK
jgi:metal-responsive CopG/Arc/MetJ family transcriptional regulator